MVTKPQVYRWCMFYEVATPARKTSRGDLIGLAPNVWSKKTEVIRHLHYDVSPN